MKKLLIALFTMLATLGLWVSPAHAYSVGVSGCNWWQVWEKHVRIDYTNPTMDQYVFVRRTNGNLEQVYIANTYLGSGNWTTTIARGAPDPELVILTATWAKATCVT